MNGVHGGITLVLRARSAGRHHQGQTQGAAAEGTARTPFRMRLGCQVCLTAGRRGGSELRRLTQPQVSRRRADYPTATAGDPSSKFGPYPGKGVMGRQQRQGRHQCRADGILIATAGCTVVGRDIIRRDNRKGCCSHGSVTASRGAVLVELISSAGLTA